MRTLLLLFLFMGACYEEPAPALGNRCSLLAVELCQEIDACGGIENNMYGCIEILESRCCGPDSPNGSCEQAVALVPDSCFLDLETWTCTDVFLHNLPSSCDLPGYEFPNPWYINTKE